MIKVKGRFEILYCKQILVVSLQNKFAKEFWKKTNTFDHN
jgi:peroxiredoxin